MKEKDLKTSDTQSLLGDSVPLLLYCIESAVFLVYKCLSQPFFDRNDNVEWVEVGVGGGVAISAWSDCYNRVKTVICNSSLCTCTWCQGKSVPLVEARSSAELFVLFVFTFLLI